MWCRPEAVIGVADIHARPLAHGVEAFEDLDRLGVIVGWEIFGPGSAIGGTLKNGRKNESELMVWCDTKNSVSYRVKSQQLICFDL